MTENGRQWMKPPGFPHRLDVRVTRAREPRDGFRIYVPQRQLARLRYRVGRLPMIRSFVRPRDAPLCQFERWSEMAGIEAESAVAMRSSAPGRWIVGLEHNDQLVAVVKCGPPDDAGLRREAELLAHLESTDPWIQSPDLLAVGQVEGCFVVITKAASPRSGQLSLDQIGELTTRLTNGAAFGAPLFHGDLAQWNVIAADDQVWLIDWEHAEYERRPMWDLANHLFRESVLVGRYTARQVVRHLIAEGSVGWTHLQKVDEDPRRARRYVLDYLEHRPKMDRSGGGFEKQLRSYLG